MRLSTLPGLRKDFLTLPTAKAEGFSAHAELCAGCPPELLRQGRRYFTCRGRQRPGSMCAAVILHGQKSKIGEVFCFVRR
jgi:hypothetical protein